MDIRDVGSRNVNPADQTRGARNVGQAPASRHASDGSDDRVTLSARAQALQETRRAALEVPEVRTDRVEAVRGKLADGTLRVDAEQIARSLLAQGIVRF